MPRPPIHTLFPYTTLFRSVGDRRDLLVGDQDVGILEDRFHPRRVGDHVGRDVALVELHPVDEDGSGPRGSLQDRKSTRLNSSHPSISYAVFCLKKKNQIKTDATTAIPACHGLDRVLPPPTARAVRRGIHYDPPVTPSLYRAPTVPHATATGTPA